MKVICCNEECKKEFDKQYNQIKAGKSNYCSRSCAAIVNNKKYKKRKREHMCKSCQEPVLSGFTYCSPCWSKEKKNTPFTIKELLEREYSHRANVFTIIRYRARKLAEEYFPIKECVKCKYNKHVEVCHKRAISDFSEDTYDTEINTKNNLVYLCRNCHWEFDKGLLNF